jgi:uncharacterized membrane protein YcaP (DUF421 family)
LAQLNAFDFIVTVAFGSALSTILLNTSDSWSESLLAIGLFAPREVDLAWLGQVIRVEISVHACLSF